MKKHLGRRILSLLLAVVLVAAGLPMTASAYQEWDVIVEDLNPQNVKNWGYETHGYENHWWESHWDTAPGNCTNYCAYIFTQKGITGVSFGNGATWANHARELGYLVNKTPAVGSVAQWDGYAPGTLVGTDEYGNEVAYGHVAYVEEVHGDHIVISEDNGGGPFRWRRIWNGSKFWPSNFIHFSDSQPPHSCTFGDNGYCSCGQYGGEKNENKSVAGQYYAESDGTVLYAKPYSGSNRVKTLRANEVVWVNSTVQNAKGETWYKLAGNIYAKKMALKEKPESKITIQMHRCPNGNILEDTEFPIVGTVDSKPYSLTDVSGYFLNTGTNEKSHNVSVKPNSKNYAIQNDDIAKALQVKSLEPGAYELHISATDTEGKTETWKQAFTVIKDKDKLDAPKASVEDVTTGKRVTLSAVEPGAVIYYTQDGSQPTNKSSKYSTPLMLNKTTTIRAFAAKSGKKDSRELNETVHIQQLRTPTITVEKTPESALIDISSDSGAKISYKLNGGSRKTFKGKFEIKNTMTIEAYATQKGYGQSETVKMKVELTAPEQPVVERATEEKIAQGSNGGITWKTASNAGSYSAEISLNGEVLETKEEISGGSFSYPLEQAGTYSFRVKASNKFGDSQWSAPVSVQSMAPVTVTFMANGEPISVQSVPYGGSATRPDAPAKRGYTFQGWSGSYRNVTEDTTIEAEYEINKYTIVFKTAKSEEITEYRRTNVPFGTELTLPEGPDSGDADYVFADWYLEDGELDATEDGKRLVAGNLTFIAVNELKNPDILAVLNNGFVQQANNPDTKFTATVQVENRTNAPMNARVVVALKSSEDKLLATGTQDVVLAGSTDGMGNENTNVTMTVSYNGRYGTAVNADISILGMDDDGRTTGAIGETQTLEINTESLWSAWSTTKPADTSGLELEESTQWRYRDKSTKSTTTKLSSPGEWTYTGRTATGNYTAWSGWSNTRVVQTSDRQVETRTIPATYKTVYYYKRWVYYNGGTRWTSYAQYGWDGEWQYLVQDQPLTYIFEWVDGVPHYGNGDGCGWWPAGASGSGAYTSNTGSQLVSNAYKQYRYRTKIYNYNYEKWSAWADWSGTQPSSSSTRQVESRTLYRWRVENTENTDTAGLRETVSGDLSAIGADLTGKHAVVMVYHGRNTDPLQSQLEYVGTTEIQSGNTYTIEINTLREMTQDTGDFVVTLAVPGATSPIEIKRFAAPVSTYTVQFLDAQGQPLGEAQQVEQYRAATAPTDLPELEGYSFTGWDRDFSDVTEDMTISPEFKKNEYIITYVDWQNQTMTSRTFQYQDLFAGPLDQEKQEVTPTFIGMNFAGWSIDGTSEGLLTEASEITASQVVYAVWSPETFTVEFMDGTGEDAQVLSTQQVEYGKAAVLPDNEPTAEAGKEFLGWSTDVTWWNVTENMKVTPIIAYSETSATPVTNLTSGRYPGEQVLELRVPEESADTQLYYKVTTYAERAEELANSAADEANQVMGLADDIPQGSVGGSPIDSGFALYEGPVAIPESSIVETYTVTEGKNNSQKVELYVEIAEGTSDEEIYDAVPLASTTITAEPGDTVDLTVNLQENPGLMGFQFYVECDRNVFTIDYDAEQETFDLEKGVVTQNGEIMVNTLEDKGWQVFWWNPTAVNENGSLFTLKLKVAEGASAGDYPVKVSYLPRNTVTTGSFEAAPGQIELQVSSPNTLQRGDVNGDGQKTLADVIKIARHIVSLETLTAEQQKVADVNSDGDITSADVVLLSRYVVGLVDTLNEEDAS